MCNHLAVFAENALDREINLEEIALYVRKLKHNKTGGL